MMCANALAAVRFGADRIDVNFGCPAPTVNKHQGGAVLLKEPERIRTIMRSLRESLPEHIPLTAKMRLGYEDTTLTLENAEALAAGGAAAIAVHARTKVQGYEPPAHWQWLAAIRARVPIPVIANGDVFTLQDYLDIRTASGCLDVMLGRGAVIRPDLARQIKQHLRGETVQAALFGDEIIGWIRLFFTLCLAREPQGKYAAARLKQWLGMMRQAYPEAQLLFDTVRPLCQADEISRMLDTFQAA